MIRNFKSVVLLSTFIALFLPSTFLADNGKPDLWRVEHNGNMSYLFGSIHLGSDDLYPMTEEVTKAYHSSDHLTVEFDLKDADQPKMMSLIQKHGLDITTPLEKRLSPKTLAVYQQACEVRKWPCQQFAPLKPWFVSLQLTIMQMQQLGYKADLGIDKHFLSMAHHSNKSVLSLESMESQIDMLAGLTQEQQELMLVQTIEETGDFLSELIQAWKEGDDGALVKMLENDSDDAASIAMHNAIFGDRNITMAEGITKHLLNGKTLFVVVGAGHIVGDDGIVELLRAGGFKVTQLQ